jgi:hypothetical protein
VTAGDTAKLLCSNTDMPLLGLNVGWQALVGVGTLKDLNKIYEGKKMELIEPEFVYLAATPKVKPNSCLNLPKSEAHLLALFHMHNDALNKYGD